MKEPSSYPQFNTTAGVCVGNLFHGSLFLYTLLLVVPKSQLPLAALSWFSPVACFRYTSIILLLHLFFIIIVNSLRCGLYSFHSKYGHVIKFLPHVF